MTWWLNNNNFQVYFLNELIPSEYSWQQFLGTLSCKWISTHIYACSYWGLSSIFPGGTVIKIPSTNTGDAERYGSIPGSGRCPEEGNGLPTRVFLPREFHGWGAWQATVHGVTKSQTWLKDCTLTHSLTVTKLSSQDMKQQYNSRLF